ncbi:MAG TPA: glycosyl transferase, partial [Firmicutes bacterium]|nr:glycosyl transferase [Bacillota bacterium]
MKKSPLIYIFILLIWAIVSSVLVWQTVNISLVLFNDRNILLWKKIVGGVAIYGNCLCFLYFWLNSVKDFLFTAFYIFLRKK